MTAPAEPEARAPAEEPEAPAGAPAGAPARAPAGAVAEAVGAPEAPEDVAAEAAAPDEPPAVRAAREGELLVLSVEPGAPFEAVRAALERLLAPRRRRAPEQPELPQLDEVAEEESSVEFELGAPAEEPAAGEEADAEATEPGVDALVPDREARPHLAARLDLGDGPLDDFEVRRLLHLLADEYAVAVTSVVATDERVRELAERRLGVRLDVRPAAPPPAEEQDEGPPEDCDGPVAAEPEPIPRPKEERAPGERRLLVVDRTVRSGSVVRYGGDVVIFGDVNAGAHVEAAGNVCVLGSLRGVAHAGAPSDDGAIILAFDLRPTQLRIGRHIGTAPARWEEEERPRGGPLAALLGRGRSAEPERRPEIAFVRDGGIVLEPYRGHLPVRTPTSPNGERE